MATKTLADFLPRVLPFVAGCPDTVAEAAVLDAAIDLCQNAKIWRYDLDAISIAANVAEYDLNYPSGTYIAEVLRATLDGTPIYPKTREDLDNECPGWEGDRATPLKGDVLGYFLSMDRRRMRIVRCPSSSISNGLIVEAALKPSRAATTLEEWIFEEHLITVSKGALWKLYEMKGEAWGSAAKADECKEAFLKMCTDANVHAAKGQSRAALRTKSIYSL